jgi:A/G-specific adenine glycosylase
MLLFTPSHIEEKKFFTKVLMKWDKNENNRAMPWKNEKDPYKIWISEIILQQTRVNQGLEYYNRFIARYPDVKKLAAAPEPEVFKVWEGLGYYSRCRNLIATAKYIANDLGGKFPEQYQDILNLKGIGSYTASAIASFAFGLPYAVLDGNVFRVLSRYTGSGMPIDNAAGKLFFSGLAHELMDKREPGKYNQAIMDFGATVCKPVPLCPICPLQKKCIAFRKGIQQELPVKEKTIKRKERWFNYLVVSFKNKFYTAKRQEKDIWQNLYEFILIETEKPVSSKQLQSTERFRALFDGIQYIIEKESPLYKQQLTHQTIHGRFVHLKLRSKLPAGNYDLIPAGKIEELPFPKFIASYLKD